MHQFERPSYVKQYREKTLLIKMSGKEFNEETFRNIEQLLKNGVKVILAYGGGVAIDSHWNEYSKQLRIKVNGIGVTTRAVLENGVMPAFDQLFWLLKSYYLEDIDKNILVPEDIKCDYKKALKYGEVGTIDEIVGIDFDRDINIVGFVGSVNEHYVNINADEIVTYMVEHYSDKINEVLFLSDQPGLLNKKGELVMVVLKSNIENILSGIDPHIKVDGGMVKKLKEIQLILNKVPKVVLTMGKCLYDEINDWRGKGTMFIDDSDLSVGNLDNKAIFSSVFTEYVSKGIFRERGGKEREGIIDRHKVVSIGNTVLGGFSLENIGESGILLECFWSAHTGCGLGSVVLKEAKRIALKKGKSLSLISRCPILGNFYKKNGFEDIGCFGIEKKNDGEGSVVYNNKIQDGLLDHLMGKPPPKLSSQMYVYNPK